MSLVWHPISCAVQLNFGGADTLHVGDAYTGTSTIRYRRQEAQPWELTTSPVGPTHDALPLHAVTTAVSATGSHGSMKPLVVKEYHLSRLRPQKALKVASVRALDDEGASAASPSDKRAGKSSQSQQSKTSTKGGKTQGGNAAKRGPTSAAEETELLQNGDVAGAKLVYFDGAGDDSCFPWGSEVELVVGFTGFIQAGDQGAIYLAGTHSSGANSGGGAGATDRFPLLTHFEVTLARWAFPCPDDPFYRMDWTLQSLTLPARYAGRVFVTGNELSRRSIQGQAGAQTQLSFSAVGPLPAYVFAFAAYPASDGIEIPEFLSLSIDHALPSVECYASEVGGTAKAESVLPESSSAANARLIPISVHADGRTSGLTEATLQTVLDALVFFVKYFTEFFHCPLPLCGSAGLNLLLAPTMPYISGMEHHGCIFLNESIFSSAPSTASGGVSNKAGDMTARIELIAHEVAHHWVGNRVGFSFAVKEGICQVLEQQAADAFLGRPARKLVALSAGSAGQPASGAGAGTSTGKTSKKKASSSAAEPSSALITETVKGKEFTGHSYQQALAQVQNRIVEVGLPVFRDKMRSVMKTHVVEVTLAEEDYGGRESMRLAGVAPQEAAYYTTDDFLALMAS